MLPIQLFCNAGMSTSILVKKMREAAAKKNEEVDIEAFPINEMKDTLNGVDVALLGPQVAYQKDRAARICGEAGVPVDAIPMVDYGMCNSDKVLSQAEKLAGGNR